MPPQIDKAAIPLDENEKIEQSLSSDNNQNVFNIEKYLLILLFIQWFTFIITLGVGIYSILNGNTTDILSGIESLIPIIFLVIYYTFGLLFTYKQNRVGLIIFASIGIIIYILAFILVGYLVLVIIALDVGFGGNISQVYVFVVFIGILFTVVSIVVIMTVKFSFDLAKSIKRNDYSTV